MERRDNIQVTGHAVVVRSQGLGNRCRLKDAALLRSIHDPVKDVTLDLAHKNRSENATGMPKHPMAG